MKLYTEDISDYKPWSGAVSTYDKIVEEGELDQLEYLIEEIYPDGISFTGLNDILWFDSDWVLSSLGIAEEEDEEEEEEEEEYENDYEE